MKRFIVIVVCCLLVGFCITLISIPNFFQGRIKETILKEIDKNVNASFYFENMTFSLTKKFPLISASFKNAALVGTEHFKYDTLFTVKEINLSFNLFAVIFDNKLEMNSLKLLYPTIQAKVLKNGLSNFDILKKDSIQQSDSKNLIDINIKHWEIKGGNLSFMNAVSNDHYQLEGLDASGSGDLKQKISDLGIKLKINKVNIRHNGLKYLTQKSFYTDMTITMNLNDQKFTFDDHLIKINDFDFKVKGSVKLLPKGINTDIQFEVAKTDFKSFLSVMPGFYEENLENIETKGEFRLAGYIKGDLGVDSLRIPTFLVDFAVDNAMFKFKNLSQAVENINFHFHAQNQDGLIESTVAHITNLNVEIGKNPIHGFLEMKGFKNLYLLADLKAKLNLGDLEKMYPLEGLALTGLVHADIKINGRYNIHDKVFPLIDAFIDFENGSVKLDSIPVPLNQIAGRAELINKTGSLSDTYIKLESLSLNIDDKPFGISGFIKNLDDMEYDLGVKGLLDFEKITQLYPVKDYDLRGIMAIDIETKGKISALMSNNWDQLTTNGKLRLEAFELNNNKTSLKTTITFANFYLTPHDIKLVELKGKFNTTNFSATGELKNYMNYIISNTGNIEGTLNLSGDSLILEEVFNTKPDTTKIIHPKDTLVTTFQIPEGINLAVKLKSIYIEFDGKKFDDISALIKLKNGCLMLNNLSFNAAGSNFKIDALYDPQDIKNVKFETTVQVNKLEFNQALLTFAKLNADQLDAATNGVFSAKYYVKGTLGFDYSPILSSITGNGKIVVDYAKVKGLKMFHSISKITKRQEMHEPELDNIVFDTEIKNAKIFIKPLTFKIGKYNVQLEGTHTFENTMNYIFKIGVPPLNKLKIPLHITGNADKPIVKLGKGHENFDFSKLDVK